MSESEIKYLNSLYELDAFENPTKIVTIAKHLGYSKPSVYYAMENLQNKQLIKKSEDKKYLLTKKGVMTIEKYLVCIDYVEKFLVNTLNCHKNVAKKDSISTVCALSTENFENLEKLLERRI